MLECQFSGSNRFIPSLSNRQREPGHLELLCIVLVSKTLTRHRYNARASPMNSCCIWPVNTFFIHVIHLVWNKKWFPQLCYNYPHFITHVLKPICAQESRVVEASKMLSPPCCMLFTAPCANWPTHYLKFPENYSKWFLTPSCLSGLCKYQLTGHGQHSAW